MLDLNYLAEDPAFLHDVALRASSFIGSAGSVLVLGTSDASQMPDLIRREVGVLNTLAEADGICVIRCVLSAQ